MLDEATVLAQTSGLSIVVGDNASTEDLSFDRELVQILEIPTIQNLKVMPRFSKLGQLIRIEYIDEFDPVDKTAISIKHSSGVEVRLNPDVSRNGSVATFKVRPSSAGTYTGEIFDDEGVIGTFDFEVRS